MAFPPLPLTVQAEFPMMTEVTPTNVPNNDIPVEMEIENDDDNENERPPDDNIHNLEDEETQPLLENVEVGLYYTEYTLRNNVIFTETDWT